MGRIYFKLDEKKEYNDYMRAIISIFILLCLTITQVPCIAADEREDAIQLYNEEMLLRDMNDKARRTTETQKPLVQKSDKQGEPTAIEIPRSIRYDTSLLEEGAKLYKSGKLREAAAAFETVLEQYRAEGFADGEAAVLGNLYLTYLAMGNENKALEYLEEYRKKRRRK
ncbi:MAG: tetratricopeptide repeat protein [Proteobacteria bacterium]|nr:tetratricopeptide repeat protein [Pseudomonadota bacterium]